MTGWAAKRFWTSAEPMKADDAFTVTLDGRPVRTPGKALLTMPSRALAEAVAEEWRVQGDRIDPGTMPMTRYANTAIDRVETQFREVAEIVAAYGETDLLCYRAESPAELAGLQAASWDPLLDWAHETYGARLVPTAGIVPVAQGDEALARLRDAVLDATAYELTALHEIVSVTGSLVLGLAVSKGAKTPEEAWEASRIDEEWQIAQWGRDEEAERAALRKRETVFEAARFLTLVRAVD